MIEFKDVAVRYASGRGREVQAIDGIDLFISPGEWVFFVGATGAGKSTLLKLIYGEAHAERGRIIVDGRDITKLPQTQIPWLRRKLGVVFQDFQLLEQKSVWENIAFALQVTGTPHKRLAPAVARALDTVGLSHRAMARPRELSGGEQQRAAIARAIVNEPLILLADEPTGNLDPQTGSEIAAVLQKIHERGTTVVMATHDRALVDALRRRVVRFANGKLVSDEAHGAYQSQTPSDGRIGENWVNSVLAQKPTHQEPQPETDSAVVEAGAPLRRNDAIDALRPAHSSPTSSPKAPLGTAENPLIVGVENPE